MAAVTENSSIATEFAGDYKVVVIDINGASGAMTCVVDEMSLVKSAICQNKVAPTAACARFVAIPATNSNIVTINAYKSDLVSTSTQTVTDFILTCIGY
jgi:hypothetical protein